RELPLHIAARPRNEDETSLPRESHQEHASPNCSTGEIGDQQSLPRTFQLIPRSQFLEAFRKTRTGVQSSPLPSCKRLSSPTLHQYPIPRVRSQLNAESHNNLSPRFSGED